MDPLKTDCRHFRPDRPCAPHKAHGVICATCTTDYDPVARRVLIVKLAAIGDVLRTTCLLPGIHRRWPGSHVTWITAPGAVELFAGNRLVDRVLAWKSTPGAGAPLELLAESFDVILNTDTAGDACALAHVARLSPGGQRVGFDLDARGAPLPLSPAAETWLELGVRDDKKRQNTRTYQDHMAAILGVDDRQEPPILELDEAALGKGRAVLARMAVGAPRGRSAIVGLNTGAGGRWRFKRWTETGYTQLIARLARDGHRVLLLGGPEEVERNQRLAQQSGGAAFDTGGDNSLREFAGIIEQCDVVVTGDTLALHIASARRKRLVALFGPTSLHEIEVFGRGERLAPELDCLVCYKTDCDFVPNCMESLSTEVVHAAVLRQIAALHSETAKPAPQARR
ncbi:MAG: glycosyltransferase family 9 protein [Planctomycetota bacterium]